MFPPRGQSTPCEEQEVAVPMLGPFTGLSMPNTTQLAPDLVQVPGQFHLQSLPGKVKEGVFL